MLFMPFSRNHNAITFAVCRVDIIPTRRVQHSELKTLCMLRKTTGVWCCTEGMKIMKGDSWIWFVLIVRDIR